MVDDQVKYRLQNCSTGWVYTGWVYNSALKEKDLKELYHFPPLPMPKCL